MLTFIKLFSWVKGHWKLFAGIVTLAITIFGGIQSCRATRAEREQLRLEGKLEEQKADQDALYEKMKGEREDRNAAEAKEKKKRKDLEARIQKVIREGEKAKRALIAEWRKTTTLPPDELSEQINQRIGEESRPTAAGLFLFTRMGANRTLNKFKEGEFHLSEYNKFQGILDDHKAEVESFNTSITECEKEKEGNLAGWDDCRETLATAIQDKEALKKIGRASKWKGRVEGAVGGGLAVFVFGKLFGIF